MTREKFIGANWKMNPPPASALNAESPYHSTHPTVVVFPMFTDIGACIDAGLMVGGQYGHYKDSGAFTGDIPMKRLKELGCTHVLCGHSERRHFHYETDQMICDQVESALRHKLIPVLCLGETEEEKSSGTTHDVLKKQLSLVLSAHSSKLTAQNFIIAYEPVWAIGSGKTPTPAEANSTHAFIRSLLPTQDIRIIYGGSMNGANAADLLSERHIDGGLPGGASLKPEDFQKIINAASTS
jgi:triosephosphate isomerase